MLVELSMLVAAGLACSTLAMPWSRAEAVPAEPTPMVGAPAQERESDPMVPVAGSWLSGRSVIWSMGTVPASFRVAERCVAPLGEQRFPEGFPPYLLEPAVLARTYH